MRSAEELRRRLESQSRQASSSRRSAHFVDSAGGTAPRHFRSWSQSPPDEDRTTLHSPGEVTFSVKYNLGRFAKDGLSVVTFNSPGWRRRNIRQQRQHSTSADGNPAVQTVYARFLLLSPEELEELSRIVFRDTLYHALMSQVPERSYIHTSVTQHSSRPQWVNFDGSVTLPTSRLSNSLGSDVGAVRQGIATVLAQTLGSDVLYARMLEPYIEDDLTFLEVGLAQGLQVAKAFSSEGYAQDALGYVNSVHVNDVCVGGREAVAKGLAVGGQGLNLGNGRSSSFASLSFGADGNAAGFLTWQGRDPAVAPASAAVSPMSRRLYVEPSARSLGYQESPDREHWNRNEGPLSPQPIAPTAHGRGWAGHPARVPWVEAEGESTMRAAGPSQGDWLPAFPHSPVVETPMARPERSVAFLTDGMASLPGQWPPPPPPAEPHAAMGRMGRHAPPPLQYRPPREQAAHAPPYVPSQATSPVHQPTKTSRSSLATAPATCACCSAYPVDGGSHSAFLSRMGAESSLRSKHASEPDTAHPWRQPAGPNSSLHSHSAPTWPDGRPHHYSDPSIAGAVTRSRGYPPRPQYYSC